MPATLRGTLFRNGSGRNELGGQWFAHWFDGDGMISTIRFDDAGIHYRNRYVATDNYLDETKAGRIVHRGFGKMRPDGLLGNAFRQPANVSNTSVVMQGDRLLSLWEGGPPTALDPATLDTRGIEDFGGVVKAFSAHPKIDPDTGELFNFGIDYGAKTTLTPYRIDRGILTAAAAGRAALSGDEPRLRAHRPNYLVFCLGPILVQPLQFLLGLKSFDGALRWDGGTADPDPAGAARRPGRAALDRDRPLLPVPLRQRLRGGRRARPRSGALSRLRHDRRGAADLLELRLAGRAAWRRSPGCASTWRRGKVETARPSTTGTANEFPSINPAYVGKRHRYAYIACNPAQRESGLQQRIARVDFESGAVASHDFGPDGLCRRTAVRSDSAGAARRTTASSS